MTEPQKEWWLLELRRADESSEHSWEALVREKRHEACKVLWERCKHLGGIREVSEWPDHARETIIWQLYETEDGERNGLRWCTKPFTWSLLEPPLDSPYRLPHPDLIDKLPEHPCKDSGKSPNGEKDGEGKRGGKGRKGGKRKK